MTEKQNITCPSLWVNTIGVLKKKIIVPTLKYRKVGANRGAQQGSYPAQHGYIGFCLTVPVLVQFPASEPGEVVENGPSAWTPVAHVGDLQ